MPKPLRKLLTFIFAIVVIATVDAAFVYRSIPSSNTNLTHLDTIIVLGTPARLDGTPSPEQRERTLEGVREFKAGIAPHLIFTGAAAHNQFVEAHVMATLALAQGIPADAIIEEGQALNSIPSSNTNLTHFDTLIVLGTPARLDGTPSPEQRERTLEGVREFKAGIAPHLIFTGAAAHNRFVEAHVMATLALAQGIPADAIIEEGQALNTIQNIFYSQRIMATHGWTSAEVVSSPSHLPRTSLILEHFPIQWRTHPSPWPPEYGFWQRTAHYAVEAEYCLKLRLFGFPTTRFLTHAA